MEAQIASLLEQTNQSQNSLIASINEMLSYQKELQDLNNTQDKEKMDLMMQSMQQAIKLIKIIYNSCRFANNWPKLAN